MKTLFAAVALLSASAMAATPAAALDASVGSQLQHFAECFNWMLTDPAKHAQLCGPGHVVFFTPSGNGHGQPHQRP